MDSQLNSDAPLEYELNPAGEVVLRVTFVLLCRGKHLVLKWVYLDLHQQFCWSKF